MSENGVILKDASYAMASFSEPTACICTATPM